MQEPNPIHERTADQSTRSRLIAILIAVGVLLLLVLLPPYFNVSRLQRRVARNISATLGRPVHFDQISLNLLPMPGFTLQNFVVDENPAFGSEPILRASQVRANLRIRSLWGRQVEFSRISLTEPSINLVHTADGQWNIGSLVMQAAGTQRSAAPFGPATPATQGNTNPTPHLPYIEASGARLDLKLDQEKTSFSLTDADFALFLSQPHQWSLRMEAHPVRTDTSPADTGTLRIEATLGGQDAASGNSTDNSLANLPINLQGSWQDVQLGGLSRLLAARDAGLRGELDLNLSLLGTLGQSNITAHIRLNNARRADFVPPRLLSVDADCQAIARNSFHTFSKIACHWPPSDSSDPKLLILSADIPDVRQLNSISATLNIPALPAESFFDWLGVATPHPPSGFIGPGTLAGNLVWTVAPQTRAYTTRSKRDAMQTAPQHPILTGELEFAHESLQLPGIDSKEIPLGTMLLRSTPPMAHPTAQRESISSTPLASFDLSPITLPLGAKQTAFLEGHADASGYVLHLTGPVLLDHLLALGDAIPQLGDGLRQLLQPVPSPTRSAPPAKPTTAPAPIHIDLTATRAWGGPQTWSQTTQAPTQKHASPAK